MHIVLSGFLRNQNRVFSVFFLVYKIIFFGGFPRVKNYAINCVFLRAPSCQKSCPRSCMLLQLLGLLQNATKCFDFDKL